MLAPWKKVMINLDSIIKSRDITLSIIVCLVKAMVFPVVMYGCEIWTMKKVERLRIYAFELWCWRFFFWGGWVVINIFYFFSFIFISWRLTILQYCSGFCHTLTWISHGFTCVPHPDPPFSLPPHPMPLGLPSAPALSTCLMHPTWAVICFTLDSILVSMLFSEAYVWNLKRW